MVMRKRHQYASNNKQLVNSENWSLKFCFNPHFLS